MNSQKPLQEPGSAPQGPTGPLAHPRLSKARDFLSLSFHQPLGVQVDLDGVRGYYIDMRVKSKSPDWPGEGTKEPGFNSWIWYSQRGLGAYERYLAGDGEEYLEFARRTADQICESQVQGGPRDGALEQLYDFPHTFPLRAPWISAMGQGEAASLLVRIHLATGDDRYAETAIRALKPMSVLTAEGGAAGLLDGRMFPEEYPTNPTSFVLNGAMFAMWGLLDVGRGLGDSEAASRFEETVDVLAENIHRWDVGWWSRYDLYPHPVRNLASLAYQELHTAQLTAMNNVAPRPQLAEAAERFGRYLRSPLSGPRALAHKVAFRARVPRNRLAPVNA
jgi:heparosan-N-sulfate-glucuronate 5-epimerase